MLIEYKPVELKRGLGTRRWSVRDWGRKKQRKSTGWVTLLWAESGENTPGRVICFNFVCVVYQNKLEADGKDIKYENKIIVIGKKMGKYLTHVKLGMIFISIKVTGKKSPGKWLTDWTIFKKKETTTSAHKNNSKQGASPHSRWLSSKESAFSAEDTGDSGSISGSERSPGGGNGNLLQYPCLENPMDRGAWQAVVHGVAESQTRLSHRAYNPKQNNND